MLLATLLFNPRWSRNLQSIITLVTTNGSSVQWSIIMNLKRRPLLLIFLLLLRGPQREPGVSWHDHQSWAFSSWSLSQASSMVTTSNIVSSGCMYLCIVTKQCKDPSTKRKGKRQRWHSGLRVDKVVSDTLLRQPLNLSFFLHKYNLWYLWQIWALHWGTGGHPEKCLFSDVDIDQYPYIHELPPTPQCLRIPFFIFENIQNYNQVSISRPFCIYR